MSIHASRTVFMGLGLLLAPIAIGQPSECSFDDLIAPGIVGEATLAAVDTAHRLTSDFEPGDLISLRNVGIADDRFLREPAAVALAAMFEAAAADEVALEVQSAYRSYAYQETVFSGWVQVLGREQALATSARPGHSEHQLGTAVDLRSRGGPAPWDLADWSLTEEGAWVAQNAWRFGFVMSYPQDSKDKTCYDYEPWHYRWVGEEAAARIDASGLTLREWLWRNDWSEGQ